MEKINLKTIIGWAGLIIAACISGTFVFTSHFLSNKSDALSVQLQDYKEKYEESITHIKKLEENSSYTSYYPGAGLLESDSTKYHNIAAEVNELEKKRNNLINQVSSQISQSLDPKSEIITLSNMLNDKNPDNQKRAIRGLFEIGNERALIVLWKYFFANPDMATSGYSPSISEWIWMMEEINIKDGINFCMELMKLKNEFYSRVGFEHLQDWINEGENFSDYTTELKSLAINSLDPLVRTRAKLLLQTKQKVEKEGKHLENRSLFRVLLDVESKVDSILIKKKR